MDNAGRRFRAVRERLNLTYRDIEEASRQIAGVKVNLEFLVTLSRLAEIENNNVLPSLYRLYSLCVIYRLNFAEALGWYGVDLGSLQDDMLAFSMDKTHLLADCPDERQQVSVPVSLDPGFRPQHTNYLSRMIQTWGTVPIALLRRLDVQHFRYGYIGLDDWMMYPLITPGALVQIDTDRKKIETTGWRNDFERPIYFLETRHSFVCSWVSPMETGTFLLQPYSLSPCKASVTTVPDEAEIVGRVTAVAMQLTAGSERVRTPSTR